jgi:cobyrinic acid a,c-diamide synthase
VLEAGQTVRAHEFHWSSLAAPPPHSEAAYVVDGQAEGFGARSTVASYLHLHLAAEADARLARRFVDRAARAGRQEPVRAA